LTFFLLLLWFKKGGVMGHENGASSACFVASAFDHFFPAVVAHVHFGVGIATVSVWVLLWVTALLASTHRVLWETAYELALVFGAPGFCMVWVFDLCATVHSFIVSWS
jgi:hypothetical protein